MPRPTRLKLFLRRKDGCFVQREKRFLYSAIFPRQRILDCVVECGVAELLDELAVSDVGSFADFFPTVESGGKGWKGKGFDLVSQVKHRWSRTVDSLIMYICSSPDSPEGRDSAAFWKML